MADYLVVLLAALMESMKAGKMVPSLAMKKAAKMVDMKVFLSVVAKAM